MKRFLIALCFWLGLLNPVAAQLTATGVGGGFGLAAAAYTGPLDVTGYTTAYAYWGFRCSKSSYTGNVALIADAATRLVQTQLTCSSGGIINQTINTLTTICATACVVLNITDQVSGQDMVAGAGGFPPFITSGLGIGSAYAMQGDGGVSNYFLVTSANATALAQPITASSILFMTSAVSGGEAFSAGSFVFQPLASVGTTTLSQDNGGTRNDYTVSHNAFHAIQSVNDGSATANNTMKVDGSAPVAASVNPGTGAIANTAKIQLMSGSSGGSVFWNGYISEVILVGAAVSSANQALQATNQCAYIGTVC